ncbi:TauD/TfdA family dioxygenase [Myxococcota bacterium]|nr:TauD/TfdA family dioxygenase [Myxococcota bacterium]
MSRLEITLPSPALGAYATGVDLSHPLDAETFERLRDAFLEHHVLVIRDQHITPEQHVAFAARWGEIFVHPYVPSIEGHPAIMEVHDPHPVTVTWHSDTTHSKTPPRMSLLLARRVPMVGGDTLFANQHLAYENLPSDLRECLDGCHARHLGTAQLASDAGLEVSEVEAIHPVVIAHPETRRSALFVNANYTRSLVDVKAEESQTLLERLYREACRPEYVFRHHWRVGDLLLWDNRSVQHRVVPDVSKGQRSLHRVTIEGDVPQ